MSIQLRRTKKTAIQSAHSSAPVTVAKAGRLAGHAAVAVLALSFSSQAMAYSSGITSNRFDSLAIGCNSGGCHTGGSAPTVVLASENGLQVAPGGTVTLNLRVESISKQVKAGFNVSATTGTLSTGLDPNVKIAQNNASGMGEATHKAKVDATATFRFQWTAPSSFTSVVLTGWGNAVDGNGGTSGDKASSSTVTITACTDSDSDGAYPTTCVGGTDCDDTKANVSPTATETCDELDNNCNGQVDEGLGGTYYSDSDHDGYGTGEGSFSCEVPPDSSTQGGDCDDTDDQAFPGNSESTAQCDDGIDQDCNGTDLSCNTSDQDGDGVSGSSGDCNDNDNTIYPGATETPYDGIDQDCSGKDLTDVDNDTHDAIAADGDDCDDNDDTVYPGAQETADEQDNDCDGVSDEGTANFDDDGDGLSESQGDCNDLNADIKPGATEVCGNGVDENCDSEDETCPTPTPTATPAPEESPTPAGDDGTTGCGCTTSPTEGASFGGAGLLLLALSRTLRRRNRR